MTNNDDTGVATPAAARGTRRWMLAVATAGIVGFAGGALVAPGTSRDSATPSGQAAQHVDVSAGQREWVSGSQARPDAGDATARADSPQEATAPPRHDHGHEHGRAPDGWREAAEGFGETFTNTSLGQSAWYEAVSSWMTPAQAEQYEQVPATSIPTGTLVEATVDDPGGALYTAGRLAYDTGLELEIGLTYDATTQSWRVASVEPARR